VGSLKKINNLFIKDIFHGYCLKRQSLKVLRAELEKFADPKSKRRKPDYYLFVTNVALSGGAETGGKDKANVVFEDYKDQLGLKDWFIWDYNQIRTMLDTHTAVRITYAVLIKFGATWIILSGVLTELLKHIKKHIEKHIEKRIEKLVVVIFEVIPSQQSAIIRYYIGV